MKKKFFLSLFIIFSLYANSQILEGGVKGGLNFVDKPTIETENSTISEIQTQFQDQSTGFHLGLYGKVKLAGIYIRPELNYSHYKSSYLDANGIPFRIESSRLGAPILVGYQFLKSLYTHAGIVTVFYFDNEDNLPELEYSDYSDFNFGFQLGMGVALKKISIEGRYERAFSDRTIDLISDNSEYEIKTNPSQFMLSLGYKF